MKQQHTLQPKLRFSEFEGDWKKEFIKNISDFIGGGTPDTSKSEFWQGNIPWISSSDIFENEILKISVSRFINLDALNNSATKLIPKGSLLIVSRVGVGKFAIAPTDICTSQDFTNLILKEDEVNNSFLAYQLFSNKNVLLKISQGTSIKGFTSSDLKSVLVLLPSLPEQQKIADYLSTIDTKINLLEEKKAQLSLYKKAMMQKLFSQEIRFKPTECHTELVEVESVEVESVEAYPEWEEKRLGDFLVKYDQKTTMNDQYPVLTSSRKGIFFQKEYYNGQDVASSDTTGYNIVPNGYFTYRHMSDDLIFKFNINTICENGIVSTLYPVFTTKNINNNFLQIKLNEGKEFKRYAILQKQGGSRTYMYFSKLIELRLSLPSLPEQQKIADFLSAIDESIEKVNEQITQTQSFKKAMLQQMFV